MTDTPAATPSPAPVAAPSAAPSDAAQRQGVIADSQYHRLSQADQARYASVRGGPDGGSEWVERSTLPSATDSPSTAPADHGKPSDPTAKVQVGEMFVSQSELQEFFQARGADELRKASLPATPNDYVAELPASLELPPGVEFKIDPADPMLAAARNWAHGKGLGQADFAELVGIYATAKAHERAFINTASAAEVAKLGVNGVQRVSALEVWLRGMVGDRLAGPMRSMMATADIVKGLEMIQHRMATQGAASFSQAHREPGHEQRGGRVSDEAYAAMTPSQKLDYSRGFDQSQFQGR